jgi:hypothetical protein
MSGPNAKAASWWRERGEPVALSALGLLALSLPPLIILEAISADQAARLALLIAWAAAALLMLRLPALLRRERVRVILIAVLGVIGLGVGLSMGFARPQPVAAQGGLSFRAEPRISRAAFAQILQRGGSPAAGAGAEIYDVIAAYGLDPAVALAFFQHESQFCTAGHCAREGLKNWGMLRRHIKAERNAGSSAGFARYASWQDGVRDWCELIIGRYINRGLDTVEKAVPVYAPRADRNVPEAYINAIRRLVASWSGRRVEAEVQLHVYGGSLDEALISETFLSSEITYHPGWAFHTFMLNEARAGRPLGAPLDDSRVVTVGGKQYAVQVFALDTLYTPIADVEAETNWGDVRRLSELIRSTPPPPTATSAP